MRRVARIGRADYIASMTTESSPRTRAVNADVRLRAQRADPSRRRVLQAGGAIAAAGLAAAPALAEDTAGNPFRDRFQSFRQTFRVEPDPEEAKRILRNIVRGREPVPGLVDLTAPDIAENGNVVPITFRVHCSMAENDRPEVVHVLAMGNPFPEVATYHFTPQSGRAEIAMRCRMRQTADLVIAAEMVDGSLGIARSRVNVTLGACS